eukprot:COSAG06_NODE_8214_length_2237_cov_1.376988_2_plen_143_part_00
MWLWQLLAIVVVTSLVRVGGSQGGAPTTVALRVDHTVLAVADRRFVSISYDASFMRRREEGRPTSGGATADCVRDEWCEFERRGQTHSSIRQGMPCTLRSCSAGATLDGAVLTITCDGAVWGVGPEQGCVLLRLVVLASSAA